MNFLEFHRYEIDAATKKSDWEKWADKVERLVGHSLDGDNSDAAKAAGTADGYSLDEAYVAWQRGEAPEQHAATVRGAK